MQHRVKIILAFAAATFALHQPVALSQEESAPVVEAVAAPAASLRQWSASVDIVRPGDDFFWDKGAGGTIKYTVMQTPTRGFAFSAGVQNWSVNEEIGLVGGNLGGGYVGAYAAQITGDAQLIPLSALGVFSHELSPGLQLGIEAGLSYIMVNSDVQYVEAIGVGRGGQSAISSYVSDVEIDDGIVAVVAADLRYRTTPSSKWTWFAGAGGQFDVSKGDTTYPATPITGAAVGESELKALFFRFGLAADL